MKIRHRNDGLRKLCQCARSQWAKCAHPWHFSYKWRGTHHRFSLDRHLGREIKSKSEAKSEAEAVRIAIRSGAFGTDLPVRDTLTLRQLLDAYEQHRAKVRKRKTTANDLSLIGSIAGVPLSLPTGQVRPFGDWLAVDVTAAALGQYREARETPQPVKRTGRGARRVGGPVAVNRAFALIRAAYNWGMLEDLCHKSPFKKGTTTAVRLTREPNRSRRLHDGEGERLLAACGSHLRPLVEAALESGCRVGELLGLRWGDVQLAAGEIRLRGEATKTRTARTIPISTRLRAVLEMRRLDPHGEEQPATAHVFGNEVGQRVGSIKTAWTLACRRAGIEGLHFHDLRREAGSRWLDLGVPIHTVRDWLGHKNVSQTSTYLAGTAKTAHEAMRRFDERRALQPLATGGENGVHSGADEGGARDERPNESGAEATTH